MIEIDERWILVLFLGIIALVLGIANHTPIYFQPETINQELKIEGIKLKIDKKLIEEYKKVFKEEPDFQELLEEKIKEELVLKYKYSMQ